MTFLPKPQRYDAEAFKSMLDDLRFSLWQPKYIVLHNTAAPSLAQFNSGPTTEEKRIQNIVSYWKGLHWHSGAHLIISPNYIWVACDLTQDGVHCSCANKASIGIEMIGDYSSENFGSGQGAAVRDKAVYAMAALHLKLGLTPTPFVLWKKGLHFHKQCTADHHDCPGQNVSKPDVVARVQDQMSTMTQSRAASRAQSRSASSPRSSRSKKKAAVG
jgi:hypothetical protein